MKVWRGILIGIGIIIFLIALSSVGKDAERGSSVGSKDVSNQSRGSVQNADKVIVVNFFGNQRCYACERLGELTKKTINEKFADNLENGSVIFKEINGEIPENREEVIKYQARGSSLFLNAVKEEKDNIEEDVGAWSYINDEAKFVSYLEGKINKLLGN
jgi:thiol-disulfide isomerase/thioredoxin